MLEKLLLGRRIERVRSGLERQRAEVGPNGWTCHVCGDYRPDAKIDVYSSMKMLGPGIPMQMNVRHCNDRESCIAGAPAIDFTKRAANDG